MTGDDADAVTVVITACNRAALLERTLRSFMRHNTHPVAHYVIVDDAGDDARGGARVNDFCTELLAPAEVTLLYNPRNLGQIEAIDAAYAHVRTPFIFHCEEDWEFYRPGFVERSMRILRQDATVVVVWLRARSGGAIKDCSHPVDVVTPTRGDDYHYMDRNYFYESYWSGFTFNPGLRRTSDYARVAPFVRACLPYHHVALPGEIDVARVYRDLGMVGAVPRDGVGYVEHIGWGQHVPRMRETALDRVDFYIGAHDRFIQLSTDDYVRSVMRVLRACGHATRVVRYAGADDAVRSLVADTGPRVAVFLQRVPSYVTRTLVEQARLAVCLLNIEKLSRPDAVAQFLTDGGFHTAHLDFSLENLRLLEGATDGLTCPRPRPRLHLPYQRNSAETAVPPSRDADVVFVGCTEGSDRRGRLLERVRAMGIGVTVLSSAYGDARDAELFRHKVLLNAHFADTFNVHEHLRVDRCVYNGMVVVSEPSLDTSLLPLREHMVIASYDALPQRLAEVLADYGPTRRRLGLDDPASRNAEAQSAAEALHACFRRAGTAAVEIRRRAAENEGWPLLRSRAARSARVVALGAGPDGVAWTLLAGLVDSTAPAPAGGDRLRELTVAVAPAPADAAAMKQAGVGAGVNVGTRALPDVDIDLLVMHPGHDPAEASRAIARIPEPQWGEENGTAFVFRGND